MTAHFAPAAPVMDLPAGIAAGMTAITGTWREAGTVVRLWAHDPDVWTGKDEARWLGWLAVARDQQDHPRRFAALAGEISSEAFSTDRGELTRTALRRAALVYGEEVSPEQCLVVGDTPHDAAGAHAAGIECVGVASHNFDAGQLRAGGTDYVIASLKEGLPL